jgi:hypothetical protein
MGCDIHLFKEYRSPDINNNKWVSYDYWYSEGTNTSIYDTAGLPLAKKHTIPMGRAFDDSAPSRNYDAFGMLAEGVRTEYPYSIECKGLPDDVTYLVRTEHQGWGADAHSATYFTEVELNALIIRLSIMTADETINRQKAYLHHMLEYMNQIPFEFHIEESTEKRIVFWFDN